MDHEKFQQRLNTVLDRRESPQHDAELRQMADRDGDCAELLLAAQSLGEGVELLKHPDVRPDMADRVVAALRVEREERGAASHLRIWVPLCVAAALLLAAIPLYRFWNADSTAPEIAAPDKNGPAVADSSPANSASDRPGDEPQYLVQTHRAGEALGEVIWSSSIDQLTPAQQQWVERATQEIRPVADPMANTVAFTVGAVMRTIEPRLPRP